MASYKRRLINYLERFIGDLVRRSNAIARFIIDLQPHINAILVQIAEREARDAAPGNPREQADDRHQAGTRLPLARQVLNTTKF